MADGNELHARYLTLAIDEARAGVQGGHGGPFGAVLVRDGAILARAYNRVTSSCDPTAHAEIVAIRAACTALGEFALPGATLYASCEPCPMCYGAIRWARIERVYYAATRDAAAAAGFDDAALYAELQNPSHPHAVTLERITHPAAEQPFEDWSQAAERILY